MTGPLSCSWPDHAGPGHPRAELHHHQGGVQTQQAPSLRSLRTDGSRNQRLSGDSEGETGRGELSFWRLKVTFTHKNLSVQHGFYRKWHKNPENGTKFIPKFPHHYWLILSSSSSVWKVVTSASVCVSVYVVTPFSLYIDKCLLCFSTMSLPTRCQCLNRSSYLSGSAFCARYDGYLSSFLPSATTF